MTLEKWLSEIEEKAKAATPGPWRPVIGASINTPWPIATIACEFLVCPEKTDRTKDFENTHYIALMNPTTTLELVSKLRVACESLKKVETLTDLNNAPFPLPDGFLEGRFMATGILVDQALASIGEIK